jgi:hypothetical protein
LVSKLQTIDLNAFAYALLESKKDNNQKNQSKVSVNIDGVKTYINLSPKTPAEKKANDDVQQRLVKNIARLNNNITEFINFDSFENICIDTAYQSTKQKGLQAELEEYFGLGVDLIDYVISDLIQKRLVNTVIAQYMDKQKANKLAFWNI